MKITVLMKTQAFENASYKDSKEEVTTALLHQALRRVVPVTGVNSLKTSERMLRQDF